MYYIIYIRAVSNREPHRKGLKIKSNPDIFQPLLYIINRFMYNDNNNNIIDIDNESGVEVLRESDDTNFLKPNGKSRKLSIYE